TLSSRERMVGYETPTCSAISLRFPPARTNISMNRWCSTGKLASRDMGNVASTEIWQWPQVMRVTTIGEAQYGHSWLTGRKSLMDAFSIKLIYTLFWFHKQQSNED